MKASNLFKHINDMTNPKLINKLRKLDGFTVINASPEKITLISHKYKDTFTITPQTNENESN